MASLPLTALTASVYSEGFNLYYEDWTGITILKMGWLGIFDGTIGWYANPLLLISIILMHYKPKKSFIMSVVALLIALSSLMYTTTFLDEKFAPRANVSFQIGFFIWLSSYIVLVICTGINYRMDNREA